MIDDERGGEGAHVRHPLDLDLVVGFAGEALGSDLIQTAGGARLSGEAAARKVALRLRG